MSHRMGVMNTFIRQSGRHTQRNTDIYKDVQLSIAMHIDVKLVMGASDSFYEFWRFINMSMCVNSNNVAFCGDAR